MPKASLSRSTTEQSGARSTHTTLQYGSVGGRLGASEIFNKKIQKGEYKAKVVDKNTARRSASFFRINPKIIAHDIYVATPNSNLVRNCDSALQMRHFPLKNGIFHTEIPVSRATQKADSIRIRSTCAARRIRLRRAAPGCGVTGGHRARTDRDQFDLSFTSRGPVGRVASLVGRSSVPSPK
jgi:hypothetical protein